MKKFVRFSIVLCFLAFVISMPFMFISPIESQAATDNPKIIYWYYSSGVLRIGDESDDVRTDYEKETGYYYITPSSYDTASGATVPWATTTYKNGVTKVKFVSSSSGNKIKPATTREWFNGFTKLATVEGFDNLELQGAMDRMFYKCTSLKLTADNVSQLDTSNVTNMNRMFYGASIADLSEDDLSKLLQWRNECGVPERFTTDDATFKEYIGFGGETLAGKMWWGYDYDEKIYYFGTEESVRKQPGVRTNLIQNTSSASNLIYRDSATSVVILGDGKIYLGSGHNLFNGLTAVTEIKGFEKLDTSHVTTMEQMFCDCKSLEELDVSGFNTSSVTTMKSAFSSCSSLTEIDVKGFVTSNVTDMSYMFSDCSSLGRPADENDESTSVPLNVTGFDMSKVTKIEGMFRKCGNLRWINGVENWDVRSVCTMFELFGECTNLKELDVSTWDTRSAGTSGNSKSFNNMFAKCSNLKELDLSNFIIDEKVSESTDMIAGTPAEKITLPNFYSDMQLNLAYGHTYWDTKTKEDIPDNKVGSGRDQDVLLRHDVHKLELIPAVAPTCTKDGTLEYYQCTICGHYFAGENFWDDKAGLYKTENIWDDEAGLYQYEVLKAPVDPATGHTPGDWITDKEPTCESLGTKHKECTVCDVLLETGTIDAKGHTESEEWEVNIKPSCTAPGSRIKKCTVCSTDEKPTILKMEIIPATGHVMGEDDYNVIKSPTCTDIGIAEGTCSICKTKLEYVEIPATGHSMKKGYTVDKAATCTESGIGHGECEKCDYKGIFEIPATGHSWETDYNMDKAPTCTTEGSESIHCEHCAATKDSKSIPATGHKFGEPIVDKAPTCTVTGISHQVCSECGQIKILEIDANGHSWETDYTVDKPATCTTEGSKSIHCKNCDATKDSEPITATGHTFGEPIVDKAPTCTEKGSQSQHCSVCGAINEDSVEEIDAKGHKFGETIVDKAATCTESGISHQVCSECGQIKILEIVANGHSWNTTPTVDVEPTCTEKGSQSQHCSVCGAINEDSVEEIDAKGHKFGETIVDKAPTCTETGISHKVCSECGQIKILEIVANGHSWNTTPTVDVEPTCTEKGSQSQHCSVCGAINEDSVEEIDAKGHTESDWIIDAEAGCVTKGSRHKECTVCEKILVTEEIPAKGHNYGTDIKQEATCETDGYTYHVCRVCGFEEKFGVITATGHTESDWIIDAEPGCVTKGSRHKECTVCGKLLKKEEIGANGHTFGDWQTANDTKHKRTCECGVVEYEDHDWDAWKIHDDESREHVCKVCGEIGLSIHTWDKGEIITPATHLTEGEIKYTCEICETPKTEVIPKITEHTFGDWEDIDETQHKRVCECGEEEIQEHAWSKWHINDDDSRKRECILCGREEVSIHTWDNDGEGVITKQPTCNETGVKIYTCIICDTKKTEILPITNKHTYSDLMTRPATCEVAGYTYHSCTVCGHTEKVEDFEATGHTESDWIVDAETDCVTKGSRHKECTICGKLLVTEEIKAKGHTYGELMLRPATCEVAGYTYHSCTVCEHTEKVEDFEATGHTFGDWEKHDDKQHRRTCACGKVEYEDHAWDDGKVITAATHMTEGEIDHTCAVCGTLKREVIPKITEHSFGAWEKYNDTLYMRTCECGEVEYDRHAWDDGEIITVATHLTEGKIKYTCQVCGTSKTEVIPKTTEHTFGAWEKHDEEQHKHTCECGEAEYEDHAWDDGKIITAATHLTEGEIDHTCAICGTLKREVIPKTTEHTFGDWEKHDEEQHKHTCECGEAEYQNHAWNDGEIITAATHLTEGEIKYTCQTCGTSKTEVIPKTTEHTFGDWEKYNETQYKRTCECGAVEYDDHAWNYGEIITAATHLTEGEIKYTCQTCGTSKTEVIPKTTEHTFGAWKDIDEIQHKRVCECGEEEIQNHAWSKWHINDDDSRERECILCGREEVSIHTWNNDGNGVITKTPTCNETGVKIYTCIICGTTKTEILPITNEHTYGDLMTRPVTCEVAGYTYHSCTVCGHTEKVEDFEAMGHTESDWIVDAEADCVTAGSKHKECTVCGKLLETETIEAKGHTYGELMLRPATCEVAGYTYHSCTVCGHTEKVEDFEATGHTFGDWEKHDDKQHRRTCACGKVEYEDHAWDDGKIITAATHLTEGEIDHTCAVCGTLKRDFIPKTAEHSFSAWEKYNETLYKRTCECGEVEYDNHAWDDGKIITAATHLTEGEIKYTCQVCGTMKTEVIPKTIEHTFGDWEKHDEEQHKHTCKCGKVEYEDHAWDDGKIINAATHLTEGEIDHTCAVCGTMKTEVIPKTTEHSFGDWENIDETQHKHTCECGEAEYQNHSWNEGEIITAATHLTEGEIKYTCNVCGTSKTEVIPKTTEHSFGDWEKYNETQYKRTCECGAVEYEDHAWNYGEIITAATHLTEGEIKYTCTMCGISKTEVIPKITEHAFGDWEDIDETQHRRTCACGEVEYQNHAWSKWHINDDDSRERECILCGREEVSIHTWNNDGEGVIIKTPTCNATGEKVYTCIICGTTKTEILPITNEHTYGNLMERPVTCEIAGYTYHSCTVCGHTEKVEDFEATGHTESDWIVDAEADCVTAGSRHKECTICGKLLETENIEAKGHTFGELMLRPATCEVAGYTYHICKDCGYIEKVADIKATGHTESDWIIDAEADCVTAGSKHKECKVCGKLLETKAIEAKGHNYGENITKAATCEEAGYTYHICKDCGYIEKVADIKATGHTESDWIIDPVADSATIGSRHKECTVCGKVLVIEKYFASEDELCNMALEDYKRKTGTTPAKAEATTNADGTLSIVLTDENGEVLDTYVIDPVTGNGTSSDGSKVNLPQTGNNSPKTVTTASAALALILLGAYAVVKSGVLRKKEDEQQ